MVLDRSCTCVSEGELEALNFFVGLDRPGGIVGYLGRYTKLLVCLSLVVFIQL